MDFQRMRKTAITGGSSLVELPEYIITSFLPGARPLLEQYPFLFRFFGIILALYYFGPIARLKSLWTQFSSMIVATVNVSSDEDLFGYLTSWISERRTFRADQVLNAMSNTPQDTGRRRMRHHDPDLEETKRMNEPPKIKYEQGQGMQLFVHKKRLFFCLRQFGEGHTYYGNRYKRMEIISISCLGRSTQPIKDLIEHIYFVNKASERSLTIIRRPYRGGQTWSRVTSKPRRALDTVILEIEQKEKVLADVAEYMDQATMTFYANHGIPYRRGYLFHGPPGVGKTSFALAIASKFNLDVYNLSLLDNDLTDSDLISLLNQLPGRSLLLLEDIDTAGLSRKGKSTTGARRGGAPFGSGFQRGQVPRDPEDYNINDDEEAGSNSRVTLSGLLNAIDGVAAPEGHVLIMTTNKPNELDDALVRAGRISVRVGFKNASKRQAEEIFLRMFIDLSTPSSLRGMEEASASSTPTEDEKAEDEFGLPNGTDTMQVRGLAKDFAALVPEGDFSPADLQDYLLIHKKDPQKAVDEAKSWMEKADEERKRKNEEQKEQKEAWREEKRKERDRFREEVKAAVMGLSSEEDEAKKGGEREDTPKEGDKDMTPEKKDGESGDKTKDTKSDEEAGTVEPGK
ncbi:hypothetical protein PV04_01973 [Phialophora macrospora]|uniref:AAA+ ATPase domain-containing protein n=1 Tax=Phialophora macrospora TaxID=1851006 RepID=A0A0D2EHP9_9EURO|nr:hypothetical protein PV04_01973 [Phialophora macrospora]